MPKTDVELNKDNIAHWPIADYVTMSLPTNGSAAKLPNHSLQVYEYCRDKQQVLVTDLQTKTF